jgi:hypothetical protein
MEISNELYNPVVLFVVIEPCVLWRGVWVINLVGTRLQREKS